MDYYQSDPNGWSYAPVAALALAVYDYLLTVSDEMRLVWHRKFSVTALLFVVIRYGSLFMCVYQMLPPYASTLNKSFTIFNDTINILVYVALAVLSALRIYAIWGKDCRPAFLVLLLGMVNPLINFLAITHVFDHDHTLAAFVLVAYIPLGFPLLADTMVVVLTWMKTIQIQRMAWHHKVKATLSFLLLRDGTFYYIAVMIARASLFNANAQYPMVFLDTVVMIMTSHLLFNLQKVYLRDDEGDMQSIQLSVTSSLRFATRAADNLGAPLDTAVWTVYDDDESEEEPQYTNNPLAAGLFDTELAHEE